MKNKIQILGVVIALLPLVVGFGKQRTRNSPAAYTDKFLWGTASSAHQTEGAYGGGENSDWYDFEHSFGNGKPSPILNSENADVATDQWHRYAEDFEIAKAIGLNSLRISLAWEKVEPSPGIFNADVISHYRDVLLKMHELGIRPMVALHHFTQPRWFQKEGGWGATQSPEYFLEYADYVVTHLGDLCDLWITFNEPQGFIQAGYLSGTTPPQIKSLAETYEALFNIASAHRLVAQMIHEKQGPSPQAKGKEGELRGVGLANSLAMYDPIDPKSEMDVRAVNALAELSQWTFLRGIISGDLEFQMPKEVSGVPSFHRALAPIQGPALDWMGVNYYTQWLIGYNSKNFPPLDWKKRTTPPLNDGGEPIYPEGLERILRQTEFQLGLPLVVTENGTADRTDSKRPQFLRDHLHFLDRSLTGSELGPPLDVRGYYYWTLTDDFEWQSGFQPYKMGLVEILFDQGLKRVTRPSAAVFRDEIMKRMETTQKSQELSKKRSTAN